jgi:hypothetical protein
VSATAINKHTAKERISSIDYAFAVELPALVLMLQEITSILSELVQDHGPMCFDYGFGPFDGFVLPENQKVLKQI